MTCFIYSGVLFCMRVTEHLKVFFLHSFTQRRGKNLASFCHKPPRFMPGGAGCNSQLGRQYKSFNMLLFFFSLIFLQMVQQGKETRETDTQYADLKAHLVPKNREIPCDKPHMPTQIWNLKMLLLFSMPHA